MMREELACSLLDMYGADSIRKALQYLYYIKRRSTMSDEQYDTFCERHKLFGGGGGSDREMDYTDLDRLRAHFISNNNIRF